MKQQKAKSAREIKIATVKSLAERITRTKTLAFTDYRGLTVNQISQLREKVKEAGGEFIVAKNSLIQRALQTTDYRLPTGAVDSSQSTVDLFTGPTATVFSYEDEIAPIKAIAESAKAIGLPSFKFGFFGQDFIDSAALESLAKIPSRPELAAKLVSALSSPIYGFVSVLSANIRNLVSVLDQAAKREVKS